MIFRVCPGHARTMRECGCECTCSGPPHHPWCRTIGAAWDGTRVGILLGYGLPMRVLGALRRWGVLTIAGLKDMHPTRDRVRQGCAPPPGSSHEARVAWWEYQYVEPLMDVRGIGAQGIAEIAAALSAYDAAVRSFSDDTPYERPEVAAWRTAQN